MLPFAIQNHPSLVPIVSGMAICSAKLLIELFDFASFCSTMFAAIVAHNEQLTPCFPSILEAVLSSWASLPRVPTTEQWSAMFLLMDMCEDFHIQHVSPIFTRIPYLSDEVMKVIHKRLPYVFADLSSTRYLFLCMHFNEQVLEWFLQYQYSTPFDAPTIARFLLMNSNSEVPMNFLQRMPI